MNIDKLITGHNKFKNSIYSKYKTNFELLAKEGQHPKFLFIACCDSRVSPELIVSSNPGDMFILRNIGNFVPPYKKDRDFHGSSAAIEYAVCVLNVTDIIICGHSHCGACSALYDDKLEKDTNLSHVSKWLELGIEAKNNAIEKFGTNNVSEELLRYTEKISIKYQIQNLTTYPYIKNKLDKNSLNIHGWYYKIKDGSIDFYDQNNDTFSTLK